MNEPLIHPVESSTSPSRSILIIVIILIILVGVAAGYIMSRRGSASSSSSTSGPGTAATGQIIGSSNTEIYRDPAVGVIEAGGLNGEGTHKLIREGGQSQTVYLVSSVINLDDYVGKKAEVWGQTIDAKTAPWLMDVGRLQLQE